MDDGLKSLARCVLPLHAAGDGLLVDVGHGWHDSTTTGSQLLERDKCLELDGEQQERKQGNQVYGLTE